MSCILVAIRAGDQNAIRTTEKKPLKEDKLLMQYILRYRKGLPQH